MLIGGLQKLTLIDYPGKVACTIFTIGCNFRCPFCYSGELVLPEKILQQERIPETELFNFLEERQGLLDGCVICGGEPTFHQDLPEFIAKIKKLGYAVKLDTNGSNPKILKDLIEDKLLDYVAMDIKSSKEKYLFYSGEKAILQDIEESVAQLKKNEVGFEFRTTMAPGITKEDIVTVAEWIGAPEVNYFLQEFSGEKEVINPEILKLPTIKKEELQQLVEVIKTKFKKCELR
ncbi:anaerobic ribonucleoside-triphosphate reductase activating protein [Candidatus Parcubacteria bacterium]|nr:anaerobic ribonucleoside-triphosphate reductase activating protein [Candidatus Parcubacteria bacterium]